MNIQEVMANSHRILDELNNHTLDVLARAEPSAQRSLRGMTGYLALQASIAEDEEDLVYIADVLHDLAADVPGMLENGYELGQLQSMTLKPVFSGQALHSFVCQQKEQLEKSLNHAHHKLNKLVTNPDPPSNLVWTENTETPWEWAGVFKDDPTWDQLLEDIERQRDMHLIGGVE